MRAHSDRGSGSVLVLALCLVALALAAAVAGLGSALVARHRAEAAADLAALAAADVLLGRAPGAPCAAAGRLVRRDRAGRTTLDDCQIEGRTARVAVSTRPVGWVAALGTATAVARAGPSPPASGQAQ